MEDEDFDALYLDLMQEFLADAKPVQWLATVCTMNYDGNGALVDWIIKQPRLEPAVAKALYWYLQPAYYQHYASEDKVPAVNRTGWHQIQALHQRFARGDLAAPSIGWDPRNDLASPTGNPKHPGYDWTAEAVPAKEAAWTIPPIMFEPVPGEQIDIYAYCDDNGWDEGMPPHVQEELNSAIEDESDSDADIDD
ncbi:DUF4274 domain-containing protein [Comamonas terrae]|uniref:DUF4274 domain-containing protein n=1 Tax=Comamonas terrae TaxID=673548 RepID=A0ABW5ULC5_9BURK|nr:DUF4274 domain-containing protein [Comamonas terrae]